MLNQLQQRRGLANAAAVFVAVVLALILGFAGVPGLLHPVLLGAFGIALGFFLARNRWMIGAGSFFVAFGIAFFVLRDVVVAFVLAWAITAGVWWWLNKSESLRSRILVGFFGPLGLVLGALPLSLIVNNISLPSVSIETTISEITDSLVTEHLVKPDVIEEVSYFGSQEGHIFTDSSGVLRSLKHYFVQKDDCRLQGDQACAEAVANYEQRLPEVVAPFAGTIRTVTSSANSGRSLDYTITMTPTSHPNVEVTLFHVKVLAPEIADYEQAGLGLEPFPDILTLFGSARNGRTMDVQAGDPLGWGIEDVSINVSAIGDPYFLIGTDGCDQGGVLGLMLRFNPACTRETKLVSYYSVLAPNLMNDWKTWGIQSIDDIVLSDDEMSRDYFMTIRNGTYFVNAGEEALRQSVVDLTTKQIAGASEQFELTEGEQLLIAMLDAGEVRVTAADGSGIEGCSCIARMDRRPGESDSGDQSPASLLSDLPIGVPLTISQGTPFVAGIVAQDQAPRVERLISGFFKPATR